MANKTRSSPLQEVHPQLKWLAELALRRSPVRPQEIVKGAQRAGLAVTITGGGSTLIHFSASDKEKRVGRVPARLEDRGRDVDPTIIKQLAYALGAIPRKDVSEA